MKKFANAEIEVVKFNNVVIATSGCTDITKADGYPEFYYENYLDSPLSDEMTLDEYLEYTNHYFDKAGNMISSHFVKR